MQGLIKDLTALLGNSQVLSMPEEMLAYANDATHYFKSRVPDAVVFPHTTEDVSKVMKYAFEKEVPVTP